MQMSQLASIILLPFFLIGCSNTDIKHVTVPKGKIAVVPAEYIPNTNFGDYAQGKATLGGVGAGAAYGAIMPLEAGAEGVILYPIIAPFTILLGGVIGGVGGATSSPEYFLREEERTAKNELNSTVSQALEEVAPSNRLSERFIEKARSSDINAGLVAGIGPTAIDGEPSYEFLRARDYAAVVELAVTYVGLNVVTSDPPRLSLQMKAKARVVNFSGLDMSSVEERTYNSYPRHIEDWQSKRGMQLMEEFQKGYGELARYFSIMLL